MFSFNNPAGACPTCDGLGVKQFIDPARVVTHPELSLAAGAIRGWDRRNAYYYQLMLSLAEHYKFDLDTPFQDLSDEIREVILYGSGKTQIAFSYMGDRGKSVSRKHPFEGVIPNMQRRYHETESNSVREDLAKFHSIRACPECHGARLTLASRNVFVNEITLPEVTAMPIGEVSTFFETLTLPGKRGEIAEKIVTEISARLSFLVNVGLDYLNLARSAETFHGTQGRQPPE